MKHLKKSYPVLILLTLAALLLAACGGTPPAPEGRWPTLTAEAAQPTQPAQPAPAGQAAQAVQPTPPAQAGQTPAAQPAQPSAVPGQDLGGKQWQWVKTNLNDGQTFNPSNPADYTIVFSMLDGKVAIKADCNNAVGEFMTDGQNLQIMIGGVTRAMCQPGSLSDEFLKELSELSAYQVQGDTLTLTTSSGTMTLTAGQAAAQPAAPAASRREPGRPHLAVE